MGWVVSYVCPLELGGPNNEGNTIILNHNTAYEKANHFPDFEVVGTKYTICHDEEDASEDRIKLDILLFTNI